MRCSRFLGIATLTAALGSIQAGQAQPAKPKPATAKVEKGPLRVEASLKGILEADRTYEMRLTPKAWLPEGRPAPLTVVKAVGHGAAVKKGDVLAELDLEKIDQAIRDLRLELAVAQTSGREAQEEVALLEKSIPVDLAAAERARRVAEEDLKRFTEIDRPLEEEAAQRSVKNAKHGLESAQEELRQLQKMYRSKDLTEETEEFILKRHRHAADMAEFDLRQTTIKRDQTINTDLPRREQAAREALAKATLALDKARTQPLSLAQKRVALEKTRHDNERSAERLRNLEGDRATFTIRAPADGIVYYGKATQGQWPALSGLASKLQRGGQLSAEEVFMTIVSPRPAFVRATVEEKDLHLLKKDQPARVSFTGYPDLKIRGKLEIASPPVPQAPGNFEAIVRLELGAEAEAILPGMACTVKVTAYDKKDALLLPSGAVFLEESDDGGHYVYVWTGSGSEKRTVTAGRTAGGKTEIVEGLKEGDEVLTAKP